MRKRQYIIAVSLILVMMLAIPVFAEDGQTAPGAGSSIAESQSAEVPGEAIGAISGDKAVLSENNESGKADIASEPDKDNENAELKDAGSENTEADNADGEDTETIDEEVVDAEPGGEVKGKNYSSELIDEEAEITETENLPEEAAEPEEVDDYGDMLTPSYTAVYEGVWDDSENRIIRED